AAALNQLLYRHHPIGAGEIRHMTLEHGRGHGREKGIAVIIDSVIVQDGEGGTSTSIADRCGQRLEEPPPVKRRFDPSRDCRAPSGRHAATTPSTCRRCHSSSISTRQRRSP